MVSIKKSALVLYSREEMFALVDNVEEYENFLPWCGGTEIIKKSDKITKHPLKLIITASSKPLPQKITKPFLKKW